MDQGIAGSAGAFPNRNGSPVSHILCITMASLRATATIALPIPTFFASRMPQALSEHHLRDLRSNAEAASASR